MLPENMRYLFDNATLQLSDTDFEHFSKLAIRAENLEKHNGAIYPALTAAAVSWIRHAYKTKKAVNKDAFQELLTDLQHVQKPVTYK